MNDDIETNSIVVFIIIFILFIWLNVEIKENRNSEYYEQGFGVDDYYEYRSQY